MNGWGWVFFAIACDMGRRAIERGERPGMESSPGVGLFFRRFRSAPVICCCALGFCSAWPGIEPDSAQYAAQISARTGLDVDDLYDFATAFDAGFNGDEEEEFSTRIRERIGWLLGRQWGAEIRGQSGPFR